MKTLKELWRAFLFTLLVIVLANLLCVAIIVPLLLASHYLGDLGLVVSILLMLLFGGTWVIYAAGKHSGY